MLFKERLVVNVSFIPFLRMRFDFKHIAPVIPIFFQMRTEEAPTGTAARPNKVNMMKLKLHDLTACSGNELSLWTSLPLTIR